MTLSLRHAAGLALSVALLPCAFRAQPARAADGDPLAPIPVNQPLTTNALLGTVEGQPIFVQDVFRPLDGELKRLATVAKDITEFRTAARENIARQLNLIKSDALILKAAKDNMQEDDDKRVEMFMNKETKDILSRYGGVQARADHELRARGSSFEKELSDKRRRFIIDLYLHRKLWPKITVTRNDVLLEYERNLKTKYTLASEVDLYTITLPVVRFLPKEPTPDGKGRPIRNPTPEQTADAERLALARARELITQISAAPTDAAFAQFAEDNSTDIRRNDGGRWPKVRQGTLASAEIEKLAFSLAPKSIGEPLLIREAVSSLSRVVIVKVGTVTQGRVVPFSEAQAEIERKLREQQYVQLTNDYYRTLLEGAAIEGIDRMLETAVDVAVTRYAVK